MSAPVMYKHDKTGKVVTIVGLALAQVNDLAINDMSPLVVYEHDGSLWVRRADEFDKRFTVLP